MIVLNSICRNPENQFLFKQFNVEKGSTSYIYIYTYVKLLKRDYIIHTIECLMLFYIIFTLIFVGLLILCSYNISILERTGRL